MTYQRTQLESGIIKTVIDGRMGVDESISSLDDLGNYVEKKSLFEAVIHTENASIDVTFDQAGAIVDRALALFNSLEAGAIAFVTNDDTMFGLCRQLQLQLDNEKVQVTVFRKEETAINWLTEIKDSV